MIEQTFLHLAGVGPAKEQRLWQHGYRRWDDLWRALNAGHSANDLLSGRVAQTRLFDDVGPQDKHALSVAWIDCLDESRRAWRDREYAFFTELLRPADQWRLLASAWKDALYLDIETTGLSTDLHYATVVGALFDGKFHQWVWPQALDELRELLQSAKLLVTFNGRRFDVPFLKAHVPNLAFPKAHVDLLYIARSAGFKGGQKIVEESLGLRRIKQSQVTDGSDAVLAWCSGLYGDREAYRQLLDYNRADVEMMPQLAAKLWTASMKSAGATTPPSRTRQSIRTATGHNPSSFSAVRSAWRKHRPGIHLLEPKLRQRFDRMPRIVGIDLRAKEANPTGWAVCEGTHTETRVLWSDEEILAATLAVKPDLVSIDAPLALPRGRTSVRDDSPCRKLGGIVRDAERILWARGIRVYPALIRQMQGLTERGIRLTKELESHGVKVIESYPGAAQDVLGIPRKKADQSLLVRGLRQFGFAFRGEKSHDELDAITSALVGYFYLADEYEGIGADDECFMIIPKWNAMSWGHTNVPTVVSLIGLPGSGKSTLSRALAARLGWQRFALGDALRKCAMNDFALRSSLDEGLLAPEELVYSLVQDAARQPISDGLIVDGFPRHARQVEEAFRLFDRPLFLLMEADPQMAINRLSNRRQRPDDDPTISRRRVEESKTSLNAMLSCLEEDRLIRLDAKLSEETLVDQAVRELRSTRR